LCTRAVGALAHYVEEEGIPTTQISLVRLHTEKIKPPRALWVPFELGRPFGVPNDDAFQTRVLLAALNLLNAEGGPVMEDFQEEAPVSETGGTPLACPVSFKGKEEELSDSQKLAVALKSEIAGMRNWYDLAREKRGRTTVGASGLDMNQVGDFICEFLLGNTPENPLPDLGFGYAVNLVVDDLKAYYYEALTAQPGQDALTAEAVNRWFWKDTVASKALYALRDIFNKGEDDLLKIVANILLIPVEFASG